MDQLPSAPCPPTAVERRSPWSTWWQDLVQAQHPSVGWLGRLALFVWVASIPSLAILANLVVKQFHEIDGNHVVAQVLHYACCSVFWPTVFFRPYRRGLSNDAFVDTLVLVQVVVVVVLARSYLINTRNVPITFRHLLPTAVVFAANSVMTWTLGIRHA